YFCGPTKLFKSFSSKITSLELSGLCLLACACALSVSISMSATDTFDKWDKVDRKAHNTNKNMIVLRKTLLIVNNNTSRESSFPISKVLFLFFKTFDNRSYVNI